MRRANRKSGLRDQSGCVKPFKSLRGTLRSDRGDDHAQRGDRPACGSYSAPCEPVADEVLNPEFLKRRVEAWYIPEYHYGHRFLEIEEENALKAADEIPIDETSLELLGLEKKEGQKVTLSFYADAADYSMTGMINMDVNFSNSFGIEEKMNRVDLESGYSLNKNDKNYIASNVNWAFLPEGMTADPSTVTALVAGTVLILLTGYLIIQYLPYIRNPGYSVLWALKDNWYDRASGEAHPAQASSAREFLHCLIKLTLFEIGTGFTLILNV